MEDIKKNSFVKIDSRSTSYTCGIVEEVYKNNTYKIRFISDNNNKWTNEVGIIERHEITAVYVLSSREGEKGLYWLNYVIRSIEGNTISSAESVGTEINDKLNNIVVNLRQNINNISNNSMNPVIKQRALNILKHVLSGSGESINTSELKKIDVNCFNIMADNRLKLPYIGNQVKEIFSASIHPKIIAKEFTTIFNDVLTIDDLKMGNEWDRLIVELNSINTNKTQLIDLIKELCKILHRALVSITCIIWERREIVKQKKELELRKNMFTQGSPIYIIKKGTTPYSRAFPEELKEQIESHVQSKSKDIDKELSDGNLTEYTFNEVNKFHQINIDIQKINEEINGWLKDEYIKQDDSVTKEFKTPRNKYSPKRIKEKCIQLISDILSKIVKRKVMVSLSFVFALGFIAFFIRNIDVSSVFHVSPPYSTGASMLHKITIIEGENEYTDIVNVRTFIRDDVKIALFPLWDLLSKFDPESYIDDDNEKTVFIFKGRELTVTMGKQEAYLDGVEVQLSWPPEFIEGEYFLPSNVVTLLGLRFKSEELVV